VSEILNVVGIVLSFGSAAFCLMMALVAPEKGIAGRIFKSDDGPFVVVGVGLFGVLLMWLSGQ